MTREQVEHRCKNVRDIGHLDWEARELLTHDAAQRRTIEQQAREIERLDKDLGAERVRGNFYKAEIDRSDALLNQFGIPNIAHECGDMLKPVDERIELVFVRLDTINQQLAARTAERDAAQQRYERQCAGTKSRLEEIVHLRSDCQKLQTLLTASEQEAGRLKIALNGLLHMDDYEMRKAHVERALKGDI